MFYVRLSILIIALSFIIYSVCPQSGRGTGTGRRVSTLNVIVQSAKKAPVTKDMFDLYDGGVAQEIETFSPIERGSKIILLVDNSINLKLDNAGLKKAAAAIVNELYEDDQMMVVGYNESAEIIEDFTPNLDKLRAATGKFVRKGFPKLFDALVAVTDALIHQMQTGEEKRAIILISDGYDSDSTVKFDQVLSILQDENIILYALQVPDRTRGALLRDGPKPPLVLEQLTVGTGGVIYPIDNTTDAAPHISDDLRNNWYRLTYSPAGISAINTRRLLIESRESGLVLRTKQAQPGHLR